MTDPATPSPLDLLTTDEILAHLARRFPVAMMFSAVSSRHQDTIHRVIHTTGCSHTIIGLAAEVKHLCLRLIVTQGP